MAETSSVITREQGAKSVDSDMAVEDVRAASVSTVASMTVPDRVLVPSETITY